MRRATFLAAVGSDLLAILTYLSQESGSVAVGEAFVRKLRARCHELAAIDGTIGRARPELRSDVRSIPYRNYIIFFRYANARFEVISILEGHRDIDTHFDQNDPK